MRQGINFTLVSLLPRAMSNGSKLRRKRSGGYDDDGVFAKKKKLIREIEHE